MHTVYVKLALQQLAIQLEQYQCGKLELFAHRTNKVVHEFNRTQEVFFFVIPEQEHSSHLMELKREYVEYNENHCGHMCVHVQHGFLTIQ